MWGFAVLQKHYFFPTSFQNFPQFSFGSRLQFYAVFKVFFCDLSGFPRRLRCAKDKIRMISHCPRTLKLLRQWGMIWIVNGLKGGFSVVLQEKGKEEKTVLQNIQKLLAVSCLETHGILKSRSSFELAFHTVTSSVNNSLTLRKHDIKTKGLFRVRV